MTDCLFCGQEKFVLVAENERSYAIRDKYPVAHLHTLIISKKHFTTAFDMTADDMASIFSLAQQCREDILREDDAVEGFNFGTNAGVVAGQSIHHVHFHLIPRRKGDSAPRMAMP